MTAMTPAQRKAARAAKQLEKQLSPRVNRACSLATTDRPISVMQLTPLRDAVMAAAVAGADDAALLAAANEFRASMGV